VYDIYERSTKLVGTGYMLTSISETTLSTVLTHFVLKKRAQDEHMPENKETFHTENIIYEIQFETSLRRNSCTKSE
jgi:hypothetical protein